MLQPNEEMTWEEMMERYPDRWVFIEQTKGEGTLEGIVRFVCTDEEVDDIWIDCLEKDLDYTKRRTTTMCNIGFISGVNCTIEAEAVYDGIEED